MKLNLGCNDTVIPGFFGVDIVPPADQIVDMEGPWPWPESCVEEVLAKDVIEHIGDCLHNSENYKCAACAWAWANSYYPIPPRHPLGRIHFMNELHRVLIPGGRALIETPNAARGVGFFCDPTHKTPWVLSSFKYFEHGAFAHTRLAKSYGITAAFKVISLGEYEYNGEDSRERVWKIEAVLAAVK
jgi:SAM-dependent methyltransferase